MATINTDEDFRKAAGQHISTNSIVGATILATDRKIISAQNVDITPNTATLEAALDTALATETEENLLRAARAALEQGRVYFRNQLIAAVPHNPQTMVGNIKPIIDGNAKLLNAITNQVNLKVLSSAWVAADVLTPTTNQNRSRYLEACQLIFGTVADAT